MCNKPSATCSFARTGSARGVVQQFHTHGLLFPVRLRTGAHKGEPALDAIAALAGPAHPAQSPQRRRLRPRPPRERLNSNGKKTLQTLPRKTVDRADPRHPPRPHQLRPYEANPRLLLGNATVHGADHAAGPATEGTALLQGPGHLPAADAG
jgi:hypothetical protein